MIPKIMQMMACFTLIASMSFCCSTFSDLGSKLTGLLDKENETVTDAPAAGEAPSNAQSEIAESGDYVYDEGGFQFTPIEGWQVNCAMGIIQMAAPDAHPEYGPAFLIMTGDNPQEMTTDEAFEKFRNESTAADIGKAEKVKVGGFSGLQAEMTSSQGDIIVKAYAVTSMLSPRRQFTLLASAPENRWESDVLPYYEDVLKSIKFISPVPGAGCPGGEALPDAMEQPAPAISQGAQMEQSGPIRQWAVYAEASSEYGSDSWSAMQATGAPNVNNCEDSVRAWASLGANTREWIELTFAVPVLPTEINIHMNYNPSQITEIQIIDIENQAYTVVETYPQYVEYCPDEYQISLDLIEEVYVDRVKIFLDQSVLGMGWNEIDAVELVGLPMGGVSAAPAPSGNPASSGSGLPSAYVPDELNPGSFGYEITGYESDNILNDDVQFQSTSDAYVVGLISETQRYIISLFITKNDLKAGTVVMIPYDQTKAAKGNTAAIYINGFLYIATSGEYQFDVNPATGKLTCTFRFQAQSKDFPERSVEVSGAVNAIQLQ